ncbi:MAG: hypothetical protein VYC81_05325, partial [Actinomycetota bacterium]|nr:hypothetical protein [Actinomycetota bacterium]
ATQATERQIQLGIAQATDAAGRQTSAHAASVIADRTRHAPVDKDPSIITRATARAHHHTG